MGSHIYTSRLEMILTGNVRDGARSADTGAGVGRDSILVLALASVVRATAVRRAGALVKARKTARGQLRGDAGGIGGGRGSQAEEAGENDGLELHVDFCGVRVVCVV